MADIASDAKISPDKSAVIGASKLLSFLWQTAWEHAPGTADGDVESLHDMRVALRRLRTTMQSFEGPKNAPLLASRLRREIREHRADIGRLGDHLGAVRDHDVLMEDVEKYVKTKLKLEIEAAPGLLELRDYLAKERLDHVGPMKKQLNRGQKPGNLRENFARWSLGLPGAAESEVSLQNAAKVIFARRLDEISLHAPALEPGGSDEELHELRKSLRRVRYTLETLSPCFSKPVKPFVKTLVELQDLLGEMQDGAVLEATTARAFGKKVPDDVTEFNRHGGRRRRYLLGQVRRAWNEHENAGFWHDLAGL